MICFFLSYETSEMLHIIEYVPSPLSDRFWCSEIVQIQRGRNQTEDARHKEMQVRALLLRKTAAVGFLL